MKSSNKWQTKRHNKNNFCSKSGKITAGIVLALLAFFLFILVHFSGVYFNGYKVLNDQLWKMIIAYLLIVEVANQISYYYAKKNERNAKIIKATIFWCFFVFFAVLFAFMSTKTGERGTLIPRRDIIVLLIFAALSWALPIYSFNTDTRFLFLYGKLKKKN